ncbi:MAG: hypothetical protein A2W93_07035 [Bacteroidetes bacterium GWF2_43_63]|nr:MAG: hypothetical protein A2W94_09845 [Bacteroidetes bacterium GWE2_42_42]OFY53790.1 MAG: hypothetical protein A2W93_07035 [Bacteroidetes bacterium GWF2_43_63]HCB61050.1 hypothetical protein [Bacteroidales bacterium]HCY24172.1 hypothetical protein [Bacteroidales bacterium]
MKKLFSTSPLFCNDIAAIFPRVILALVFMFHGGQKMFGWFGGGGLEATAAFMNINLDIPVFLGYAAALAEFFGAVFILLGLFTRLSAFVLGSTMLVAIVTVHPDAFLLAEGGMEYTLTLLFMSVVAFILGPGKISLDAVLFKKCITNEKCHK